MVPCRFSLLELTKKIDLSGAKGWIQIDIMGSEEKYIILPSKGIYLWAEGRQFGREQDQEVLCDPDIQKTLGMAFLLEPGRPIHKFKSIKELVDSLD